MRAKRLTIKQRKEIFHALVTTQDQALMSTADSIKHVGQLFKVDENQVEQIIDEGIEKDWLDEEVTAMS